MRDTTLRMHGAIRTLGLVLALLSWIGCDDPARNARPPTLTEHELSALQNLGYTGEALETPDDAKLGVLVNDPGRVRTGLDYVTDAGTCSSRITFPDGTPLREWSHTPCTRWANTILTPNGDVLAVHLYSRKETSPKQGRSGSSLLRFDWDGNLLWEKRIPVHHDVGTAPDGRIVTLTSEFRVVPDLHPTLPVKDDLITVLTPEGEWIEAASLTEMMLRAGDAFSWTPVEPEVKHDIERLDFVHANAVHWMGSTAASEDDGLYSADHLLVTSRAQNALLVVHWPTREIVWSWGPGELDGPHDGNVTAEGNFLVFDNGLNRTQSRVLELDPRNKRIVWEYSGHPFYSATRSSAQRLPSGNTLVTVSNEAKSFEVTPEGEIVGEYLNKRLGPRGKPVSFSRVRNYEPDDALLPREYFD